MSGSRAQRLQIGQSRGSGVGWRSFDFMQKFLNGRHLSVETRRYLIMRNRFLSKTRCRWKWGQSLACHLRVFRGWGYVGFGYPIKHFQSGGQIINFWWISTLMILSWLNLIWLWLIQCCVPPHFQSTVDLISTLKVKNADISVTRQMMTPSLFAKTFLWPWAIFFC